MSQTPSALAEELAPLVARVKPGELMSRHSTFGIGGPADFYVEVKTEAQAKSLMRWTRDRNLPLFPVGQGSNLLVGDKGLRGVVVRLRGELEEAVFDGEIVTVGAGAAWPSFAKKCAERGLAGAEPMVGVPGTIGGGLMTNAGTPEGDTGSLVESVDVLEPSGETVTVEKKDMVFRYRHSSLKGRFVLRARLKLRRENGNDIMARLQKQLDRRAKTQPLGTYNVGSIFKNPPGDHAARLVEAAGLKGLREGGAQVSPRHANFIVNADHATAADVRRLIDRIRREVAEKFNVQLELEVMPVGEP
jgi:UDP-N-acetylmuramate dehydrogenase